MSTTYELQAFRAETVADEVGAHREGSDAFYAAIERSEPDHVQGYDGIEPLAVAFGTGMFLEGAGSWYVRMSAVCDGRRRPLTGDEKAIVAEHGAA